MKTKKSMAFVSTGYMALQQKYIIKVADQYRKIGNHRVAILTCNLFDGHLAELLGPRLVGKHLYKTSSNVHLFDWMAYLEEGRSIDLIKSLNNYTMLLWDFPDIENLKKYEHAFTIFFPYINEVNFLSYNNKNLSCVIFENEVRDYFNGHGLPLDSEEVRENKIQVIANYFINKIVNVKKFLSEKEHKKDAIL